MNTTASTRISWVVLITLLLTAGKAAAGPPQGTGDLLLGAAGVGQAASSPAEDKSQEAADLLRRARQAMAENDLQAAESLIAQAEALGVEYGSFHLGDTPKKARRDLQRKRSAAAPTKPSQIFSPFLGNKAKVPASDPFSGRPNDAPATLPDARQVTPLPRIEGGTEHKLSSTLSVVEAGTAAESNYLSTEPNENDLALPPFLVKGAKGAGERNGLDGRGNRAGVNNDDPLLTARRALAVGDLHRADEFAQQAKNQNRQYSPLDDSPEKAEAAIRKMQELATLDKNTEAYRRAFARNMLEQAEALLQHRELDEAERLVNLSASKKVAYGPAETKPQDLMARIASMRNYQLPPQIAAMNRDLGNSAHGASPGQKLRLPTSLGFGASSTRSAGRGRVGSRGGAGAKPTNLTCPTRCFRRAKTGRAWYCWTFVRFASASHPRLFPPPIMELRRLQASQKRGRRPRGRFMIRSMI